MHILQLQCGVYDAAGCTDFYLLKTQFLRGIGTCALYARAGYMRENTVMKHVISVT